MRLHHLSAEAFGPFASSVQVDFDALSDAGLFLLAGATGAGKTSVLDAVCFALYGEVPGDRGTVKRLRCDQAPADSACRVTLDVTLVGRRFRISRSPAWERPKKRGSGTTTEPAKVVVSELVDGEYVPVSTRLDEAGQLVSGLVGMTHRQFVQVAMLPQGRFQEFLRSRADERQRLLEQLFRTERFADVERWLRERRVDLRRRSESAEGRLSTLVGRVCEAAGHEPPQGVDTDDLWPAVAHDELAGWLTELVSRASQQIAEAGQRAARAAEAEAAARDALERARAEAERHQRLRTAVGERERLREQEPELETARARLDAARKAAAVAPLHSVAVSTAQERSAAADEYRSARSRLRALLADGEADEVAVADRLAGLRREHDDAVAAGHEIARLDAGRVELVERLDTLRRLDEVLVSLEAARHELQAAREVVVERREAWLDLREARLDGMAAEIACELAVGASCPVCGSHEHPSKATPAPGAPDAQAEKAARRQVDDAAATELARAEKVRDLETRLELLHERAGEEGREQVEAQLEGLESELHERRSLAAAGEALARQISRLDDAARVERERRDRAAEADERYARAREALETAAAEAGFDSPHDAIGAVLDAADADRLAELVARHDQRVAAVSAVLADLDPAELDAAPPDVAARAADHRAALDALGAARAQAAEHERRADRLQALDAEVTTAVEMWRPLHDDLALATALSSFVEGKSPDNRLQMRLSAYVLAYRLAQVVAAANERLVTMSDQRYSLEHTAGRGARDTRGGLGLQVRDDWSGESRDPATLSGGETFVVSLALALGLADVITHESDAAAEGSRLETLFVDEGFGSLDPDTLDDVMDTLDSLRDGGRVVGVVSHVAEMRDRIPVQLRVTKSRHGSSVTIHR